MALIFLNENIVDNYDEISEKDKASLDTLNLIGMNYKAGLNMNFVSVCVPHSKTPFKDKLSDETLQQDDFVKDCHPESQIKHVVELNNQRGFATDFVKQVVSDQYKKVSEKSEQKPKKKRAKKSITALMHQSVFHGKNWLGNNFIA